MDEKQNWQEQYRSLVNRSNEELIELVAGDYRGKTIKELQKNDGSLYHSVQKRRLIDKLVDMRILYRARRDLKFLRTMNDDEFMGFVAENYPNMSPSEFKREDRSVYNIALKRKLIGELVDRGVLVRKLKSH